MAPILAGATDSSRRWASRGSPVTALERLIQYRTATGSAPSAAACCRAVATWGGRIADLFLGGGLHARAGGVLLGLGRHYQRARQRELRLRVPRACQAALLEGAHGFGRALDAQVKLARPLLHIGLVGANLEGALHDLDGLGGVAERRQAVGDGGHEAALARVDAGGLAVERQRRLYLALFFADFAKHVARLGIARAQIHSVLQVLGGLVELAQREGGPGRLAHQQRVARISGQRLLQRAEGLGGLPQLEQRQAEPGAQ